MSSVRDASTTTNFCASPSYDVGPRLCKLPMEEVQCDDYNLEYYPEIKIACEPCNTSVVDDADTSYSWRSVMIPVNENPLKRITRTFFESGFYNALTEARDSETEASYPLIATAAEFIHRSMRYIDTLRLKVFPYRREQGLQAVATFSETKDWIRSSVRCIAWHPNCFKIAVAGADDFIRIYTDQPAIVPMLKNANQKLITCLAWRPFTAAEIAVGCKKGICVWTMDNSLHITRISSQMVFLTHPRHSPITSLQWNSDGNLLASASIGDTDILIWNVDRQENSVLQRVGPACTILKWSPDNSCLFSATIGNVFRIWHTEKKWQPERWTINAGNIQSACWSPCSSFLLFVNTEDTLLYSMPINEEQLFTNEYFPKRALPIADLGRQCTPSSIEVGGRPQALAWDPNGLFLAITFKDTKSIAIFTTCVQKFNINVNPLYFLTGIGDEYASYVCFQSKTNRNTNSVLTIGWSSGRIQYYPLDNL